MVNNLEVNVIQQGLDLMIYGMGSVFAFLTLLVIGTFVMSRVVSRFFPEAEQPLTKSKLKTMAVPAEKQHAKAIAVIEDAIRQHRAKA